MVPEKMSNTFFFLLRFSLSTVIVFQISLDLFLLDSIFVHLDILFVKLFVLNATSHQVCTLNEHHVLARHVVLLKKSRRDLNLHPPHKKNKLRHLNPSLKYRCTETE